MKSKIICVVSVFTLMAFTQCIAAQPQLVINTGTAEVTDAPENSTMITAFYNDGILSSVNVYEGSGTITADISGNEYDMIKVFLWDMQTITPLVPAEEKGEINLYIRANGNEFIADIADNSSAEAFVERLKQGPITVDMSDYGNFEKVGALGFTLPLNDEQITTVPGDIILYQGNSITIYYDTNTWNFTRLGRIEGVTGDELKSALGSGDVEVTFSLE